ncbi:MAG: nicotinate-nucleotide adenylyltransferase [Chromatiales bacterium]|jgi:nicotinate-nucleotide adenylyltransferase
MIGVFGGTFDPVHYGHLNTAREIAQRIGLSQVRLVPLNVAVHRDQPQASAQQRLDMLRLAISDEPLLAVDERELQRSGKSYMVDTLQSLHDAMPQSHLCLLIGVDAFAFFAAWREPQRILQLAHLVVLQRPGYQLSPDTELADMLQQHETTDIGELQRESAGKILQQTVSQHDISATDIRARIRQQLPLDGLTPPAVIDYIVQQHLYH